MRVHLDVLESVFARLDGADLAACTLVSRLFLAGAIPALYATIEYTVRHAHRAHVQSPFATVAAHPHLAVHLKHVAVHAAPVAEERAVDPSFLDGLSRALAAATTLRAFVCTVHILPPLLLTLADRPALAHLRIYAGLGARQTAVLARCTGLRSLALDTPSPAVLDALPAWSAAMHALAHLTLFMSQDLDPAILHTLLSQLPRLRGLHVVACPRITHAVVLGALVHTPHLHHLSFSIFPSQDVHLPPLDFPVPPLSHLAIDVRASSPGLRSLIARTVARLAPTDALAICGGWIGEIKSSAEHAEDPLPPQIADDPPPPPAFFVNGIPYIPPTPDSDAPSLPASLPSTLSVLHLPQLSPAALGEIVDHCPALRVLGIVIGDAFASTAGKGRQTSHSKIRVEINALASILSRAKALRELILDTSPICSPGSGISPDCVLLTSSSVTALMHESPLLRRIVGEGRVWESSTPAPSPQSIPIHLSLSRARYHPGAGSSHAHAPRSIGATGQIEASNNHWFWLTDTDNGFRA